MTASPAVETVMTVMALVIVLTTILVALIHAHKRRQEAADREARANLDRINRYRRSP